ncbi:MAG: caspase family protein [Nanoarchaeota archaeon]|nr:caspase family protein [Nanoarchaeota archaeon]
MGFKKSLKALALASSLFFALNLNSCVATSIVGKHKKGDSYQEFSKPKNRYAVLVLGAYPEDNVLEEKALKVYDGLKSLGFSDENINFLVVQNSDKVKDLADGVFTQYTFNVVCSYLSKKMGKEDMFLFFYMGHGDYPSVENLNKGYMLLKAVESDEFGEDPSESFYVSDLEAGLEALNYEYAVFVVDACMSGGFVKPLGKKNRVGVSSSCPHQTTWLRSEFSPLLVKALNGEKSADNDGNGKVSLEEAVYYATEKDPWSKKYKGIKSWFPEPQIYYEDVDPSKVFLNE